MADCTECKVRGICCTRIVHLKQDGMNFYSKDPAFICEHLDVKTGKCKNYKNRPEACKEYDCKGNPQPMHLFIKGETDGYKQDKRRKKKGQDTKKILT